MTLAPTRPSSWSGGSPESPPAATPQLADGIDLIGEFEGSGYKEPHYLARRADGQTIQLSHLLFLVAEATDGSRDSAAIAEVVTEKFGRPVSGDNVDFLVKEKLRPLGVLKDEQGRSPDVTPLDPLLALKYRIGFVPEGAVRAITTVFRPLFWSPVVLVAVTAAIALDVWLFGVHGIAQGVRETLTEPLLFLLVFALIVLSAAFHEIGHATACAYGGAKPGVMGAGLYLVWPAFYTDVTDAYRLSRAGRLRTDLGGVYFNALFCLATFGVYLATGFEPLLLVITFQQFEIVHQMLPFLRLDGYYVVSDLTGVPDLFMRMKPILRSAMPGAESDERVTELKPWVRVAVTGWVLAVVPILLVQLVMLSLHLPRILATAWESGQTTWTDITASASDGGFGAAAVGIVQLLLLALPIAGIVLLFVRLGQRVLGGAWSWSSGHPLRRGILLTGGAALAGLVVLSWWPAAPNFRPISPDDRGTVFDGVEVARSVPVRIRERDPLGRTLVPSSSPSADASATASPTATPSPTASGTPSTSASASPGSSATAEPAPAPGPAGPAPQQSAPPEPSAPPSASPAPSRSPAAQSPSAQPAPPPSQSPPAEPSPSESPSPSPPTSPGSTP